jgi:hypothetical protein
MGKIKQRFVPSQKIARNQNSHSCKENIYKLLILHQNRAKRWKTEFIRCFPKRKETASSDLNSYFVKAPLYKELIPCNKFVQGTKYHAVNYACIKTGRRILWIISTALYKY